jgi:hypothetical protein
MNTESSRSLPPAAPPSTPAGVPESPLAPLARQLLFGLSLPERVVRSAVGLTAGAVKELAGFIVPSAFQTSKSYEIAITNSLNFLTETVGGVKGAETKADEAGEAIARKAVGNFMDLAGLATFHVSPMWVLAVVSDVCYGTKTYVAEVAKELQAQGVIDDASTIHHVDDILDAIQRASGSAASTFDKPPLSVEELRKTIDETRQSLAHADVLKLIPQAELAGYWNEMQQAAAADNVSLLDVSAAITMSTLGRVGTVSQGALTGVRVAGGIFNRNVLRHYRDSLNRLIEKGFYEMVRESYQPYVDAVWTNFSGEKKSWTEQVLDPNNVVVGMKKVWGLFDGKAADGVPDAPGVRDTGPH